MRKNWKEYLVVIISLLCLAIIGCGSFIEGITPCPIPDRSIRYAGVDPNDIGFQSLTDAKEVRNAIIIKHRTVQIDLRRLAEDDKYASQDAKGFLDANIEAAEAWLDLVIGDEGQPFSILGIIAGLGFGGVAGKELFKRRKDYTPEQHQQELTVAYDAGRVDESKALKT